MASIPVTVRNSNWSDDVRNRTAGVVADSPGSTAFPKRPALGENSTAQVAAATAAPISCATMKPGRD